MQRSPSSSLSSPDCHPNSPNSARTIARRSDEIRHAHTAIVEAIITGDSGLAQHRMRRHLSALADRYSTADHR
jgi:DNA-binding FadR family transcriptional regulator